MLGVIATQEVEITPTLRHLELYTMRGLLTVLWHANGDEKAAVEGALALTCSERANVGTLRHPVEKGVTTEGVQM